MHKIKKLVPIALLSFLGCFVAGCGALPFPMGAVYTDVNFPIAVSANVRGSKMGQWNCISVLNLVALGDASIQEAARNGGITKIAHVDWKAHSILGIFSHYTVTV